MHGIVASCVKSATQCVGSYSARAGYYCIAPTIALSKQTHFALGYPGGFLEEIFIGCLNPHAKKREIIFTTVHQSKLLLALTVMVTIT